MPTVNQGRRTLKRTIDGNRLQAVRNVILLASLSVITRALPSSTSVSPLLFAIASLGVYVAYMVHYFQDLWRNGFPLITPDTSVLVFVFELLFLVGMGFNFTYIT